MNIYKVITVIVDDDDYDKSEFLFTDKEKASAVFDAEVNTLENTTLRFVAKLCVYEESYNGQYVLTQTLRRYDNY